MNQDQAEKDRLWAELVAAKKGGDAATIAAAQRRFDNAKVYPYSTERRDYSTDPRDYQDPNKYRNQPEIDRLEKELVAAKKGRDEATIVAAQKRLDDAKAKPVS